MKNRKVKIIIIVILCSVVSILSIGYALIASRLSISGTATVPGGKCSVAFSSNKATTTKVGSAECKIGDISGTSITGLKATFKKPGDSCSFTIPVENDGDMYDYLTDVTGKDSELAFEGNGDSKTDDENLLRNYVTYEVKYGDSIIDSKTDFNAVDIITKGKSKTITLKVTFLYEATQVPKNAVTITGLDRTFIFDCNFQNISGATECEDGNIIPTPITTPNAPVLNGDMIPVYYQETSETTGDWKVADRNNADNNWYDYTNQKWANAVTVTQDNRDTYKDAPKDTIIPMEAINTMWVWIPRYSYTIKQSYGKRNSCEEKPSAELPGEIDVKFVSKETTDEGIAQYTGDMATNWRTNDAFNFGGENRDGIWVAKFETTGSYSETCKDETCDISNVTIKPGESSIEKKTVSSFFYMSRSMQKVDNPYGFNPASGDLHMMKNDEWGAVAYLSQSIYGKYGNSEYTGANKEVYKNNSSDYITGNSGGKPTGNVASGITYAYNNLTSLGEGQGQAGPGASTTGTIYGVYDMSGGLSEYVMGVLEYDEQGVTTNGGKIATGSSGFRGLYEDYNGKVGEIGTINLPDKKYYNVYKTKDPTSDNFDLNASTACNGGVCYGHALSETAQWYADYKNFIYRESSWFTCGGVNSLAGVFSTNVANGYSINIYTTRLTLAP